MDFKKHILLVIVAGLISVIVGSISAWFLHSLNWVTQIRENFSILIWFLPFAGLIIGLAYYYFGKEVVKGNNLVLEASRDENVTVPLLMTPFIFLSTIITHLFGGSAGREGTAVQMGASVSDSISRYFKIDNINKSHLMIIGMSSGFASVFGTPLTASVFVLEVLLFKRFSVLKMLLSVWSAWIAYLTCELWNPLHTHYHISLMPSFNLQTIIYVMLAGLLFGICAWIFSFCLNTISSLFTYISFPPLRPFVGGLLLAAIINFFSVQKFLGLGIPTIQASFITILEPYDFVIKIVLTALTLGAGFKGGEVTPLFFIGATLGNVLSLWIPLPMAFLAGLGFVAVFAGATNTPLACAIMGMELFGWQFGVYMLLACVTAYLSSGKQGIYASQEVSVIKQKLYRFIK